MRNDFIICEEESIWLRIAHYNLAGRTEENQKTLLGLAVVCLIFNPAISQIQFKIVKMLFC